MPSFFISVKLVLWSFIVFCRRSHRFLFNLHSREFLKQIL